MQVLGCTRNPVAQINAAPAMAQIGNEVHLTNVSAAVARKTKKHIIQFSSFFFLLYSCCIMCSTLISRPKFCVMQTYCDYQVLIEH